MSPEIGQTDPKMSTVVKFYPENLATERVF
jgi:hypothetical protein